MMVQSSKVDAAKCLLDASEEALSLIKCLDDDLSVGLDFMYRGEGFRIRICIEEEEEWARPAR